MTQTLDTSSNSSFSPLLPGLQLAVDSTSLGEAKLCLRKYFYGIVLGYQPRSESVHLTFGLLFHKAHEIYHHERVRKQSHDDALASALVHVLRATWNKELSRPWASDHKTKNRLTLVRSVVWYLDHYEHDNIETLVLANGKPAVELSFRFDSRYVTRSTGERVLFCGHLDRMGKFNDEPVILDPKTTEHTIDARWFSKFTPFNQFSMYSLAGRVAFATPVKTLIVDGLQIGVGFTRMERGLIQRDEPMLEEWTRDAFWVLRSMEAAASENHWPLNDKACDMYGGCPFRPVCSRTPVARETWLAADYKKRIWDPLRIRGDI